MDPSVTTGSGGPPTPKQCGEENCAASAEGPDQSTTPNERDIREQLLALKFKLSELEGIANRTGKHHGSQDAEHSDATREIEEYKRMENCLYRHRKEWQSTQDHLLPGDWDMELRTRMWENTNETWPWNIRWDWVGDRGYQRPDPFDPSHECIKEMPDEKDAYDLEIDYGMRRERVRKNFEWDIDRLFVAEEFQKRKAARAKDKLDEEKAKARAEAAKESEDKGSEDKGSEIAAPSLNRLGWNAFKLLFRVEEKDSNTIDILVGEPNFDKDFGNGAWYSPGQETGMDKNQDPQATASRTYVQAPLPERIRIHSRVLRLIFDKILDTETFLFDTEDTTSIVVVRPFKVIFYCQKNLQTWHEALEDKFHQEDEVERGTSDPLESDSLHNSIKEQDVDSTGSASHTQNTSPHKPAQGNNTESWDENEPDADDQNDITKSAAALEHLKCILSFIDSDIAAKSAYLNSPKCRKVFFSDLWYLFRPGVEVIGSDGKQAYRVIGVTSPRHRVVPAWQKWYYGDKKSSAPFSISCVYIDFDGHNLGPVSKVFDFRQFDGERDVLSLEVYPLRFHPLKRADFSEPEWEALEEFAPEERYRQSLIARGAKFLDTVGVRHMYYVGPTLGLREEIESQVVVDFETAFTATSKEETRWKPQLEVLLGNPAPPNPEDESDQDMLCRAACCRNDYVYDDTYIDQKQRMDYVNSLLPKEMDVGQQPPVAIFPQALSELRGNTKNDFPSITVDDKVIMSYRVFGFVLRNRKWAQLDLKHLHEVHESLTDVNTNQNERILGELEGPKYETAFDRLVLEEGHKPMILSLIAQHFRDKETRTGQTEEVDIVKGKGKGLILLLHGAPGVGKTSTAEGVAELFRKPLFQITCGDLGTTAREVEAALETNFALANRWGCVLLLDEADVFLAARTKEDFIRNGLVAVFLRVMEYYAGILFLTTNRVGDFDEAFTSRIHISLYYPELTSDKTVEVFRINLKMIERRFRDKMRTIVIDDIEDFARSHFERHPQARWNGRQIRNACQTALALAEFEAQGNSHRAIMKPDAVVHLKKSHFETVQKAYIEFTEYVNKLFGATAGRRAKESRIRNVWVDENDKIIAEDRKAAFHALASQHQQPPQPQPQQQPQFVSPQFQQGYQQQGFPVDSRTVMNPGMMQQHYQQPGYPAMQPMYSQAPIQTMMGQQLQPQSQQQQPTMSHSWGSPSGNVTGSPAYTSQGGVQGLSPQKLPQTPSPGQGNRQDRTPQPDQAWLNQDMRAIYEAGNPQGSGQMMYSSPAGEQYPQGSSAPGQPGTRQA